MKKILIYGLKEPIGGVEKVVLSYTQKFNCDELVCDYLMFGDHFHFEKEINKCKGKIFYLPNRIKNPKEYKEKFEQIFKTCSYDAVWGNFAGLTNIDIIKLAKKYRVPIRIAHSHGCALGWNGRLMRYLVPFFHHINKVKIKNYATDFWGCSKEAAQFMFPKSVHKKIKVINNAIDSSVFYSNPEKRKAIRNELGIDNCFVIGHIARMCEEKNQFFMLDIFKEFLKTNSNAKLLFVGDGDIKRELESKAMADGTFNNILFLGFKENVADYHRAANVFLFPSLAEGLGLSLIEAQACGVPCVASANIPSIADISGCVSFIGLDKPISVWCESINRMGKKTILNSTELIKKSNYDINEEAKKVANFFVNGEFR